MKNYCLALFLVLTATCFAQENKSDSIRWIRLAKNKVNALFFQYDYSVKNSGTLIGCAWENTINSSNVFFIEYSDIAEKKKLYFELQKYTASDSIRLNEYNKNYIKNLDSLWRENIVFNFRNDHPFLDESGNDYMIDCLGFFQFTSGQLCFWYPPEFPVLLPINGIREIRIREQIQWNAETNTPEYIPTAIQLYTHHQDNLQNNIWLDLIRLKQNNPEVVNTNWFQALTSKSYDGEQYMQLKSR